MQDKSVEFNLGKTSDWILINPSFYGFYRTQYSNDLLQMLKENLSFLNASDRLQLENSAFALVIINLMKVFCFLFENSHLYYLNSQRLELA